MSVLSETNKLILFHEFETVWLKEKPTGKILFEEEIYGDPECGLIDEDNNWAAIGGEHLTIWVNSQATSLKIQDLQWVVALRVKSKNIIEILTDPWREGSAIWELNIRTLDIRKSRDFPDYREKEYTEEIEW